MALVTAAVVVLDCAEPEKLAAFYKEMLGAEETDASGNRVEIKGADGMRMAFRRDVTATPPSWPRPENSFQAHIDFHVEDLDAAERQVIGLGGRPLETKDMAGPYEERGYADPSGHSFTLRCVRSPAPTQGFSGGPGHGGRGPPGRFCRGRRSWRRRATRPSNARWPSRPTGPPRCVRRRRSHPGWLPRGSQWWWSRRPAAHGRRRAPRGRRRRRTRGR